jgi:hypothetical protein
MLHCSPLPNEAAEKVAALAKSGFLFQAAGVNLDEPVPRPLAALRAGANPMFDQDVLHGLPAEAVTGILGVAEVFVQRSSAGEAAILEIDGQKSSAGVQVAPQSRQGVARDRPGGQRLREPADFLALG